MPIPACGAAPREGGPLIVNGLKIETIEGGEGRPLLFLHPGIGLDPKAPVLDALAAKARLIAPSLEDVGDHGPILSQTGARGRVISTPGRRPIAATEGATGI